MSFTAVAGINSDYGVDTVSVSGTGLYTITWDTAFSNNDYSVQAVTATGAARHTVIHDVTTTVVKVQAFNASGTTIAADSHITAHGDH